MKKDCNHSDILLNRNGTDQNQRFLKALDPDSIKLYDLSMEDWMTFAYQFAGSVNYFDLAKKILKNSQGKLKKVELIPINSNIYIKIKKKQKVAERPLNSLLNITKLEKFLNTKMPDWENIFIKKVPTLIRNYKK